MTNRAKLSLAVLLIYFSNISLANAITYFRGNSLTPTLLENPFANDSAERNAEIEYIINLQKNASEAELTQASDEYFMKAENIVQPTIPHLTRKEYPLLYRLLDFSEETAQESKDEMKNYWKVPRPYKMSKKIKKLLPLKPASNNAYPSGHTARSYTIAYVMGLLFPEKRAEFIKTAERIVNRRVLIGEHFPSDLAAGRKLAFLIVGGLIQNTDFKRDVENVKAEIRRNSGRVWF